MAICWYIQWFQSTFIIIIRTEQRSLRIYLIPSVYSCFPFACVFLHYILYPSSLYVVDNLGFISSLSYPHRTMAFVKLSKLRNKKKEKKQQQNNSSNNDTKWTQKNCTQSQALFGTYKRFLACIRYAHITYIEWFAFGTSLLSTKNFSSIICLSGNTHVLQSMCKNLFQLTH